MKKLTLILLAALLGGATISAQTITWDEVEVTTVNEQWQCLNVANSEENASETDGKLIETPYGVLLYGKFTEINGDDLYNGAAIVNDNEIEPAPFTTDEYSQIFDVEVKNQEVILVTNVGIYSWFGDDQIIPWGIDIDLNLENPIEERIFAKFFDEKFIFSGDIAYINGEPGFVGVVDFESKNMINIFNKEGYTGGDSEVLKDTLWVAYYPSEEAAANDWISLMGFDLSSGQQIPANIPFTVVGVGNMEIINDTMYVVYSDLTLESKMIKYDGTSWGISFPFYGISLFSLEEKLYANPGPIEFTGTGWKFIADSDSTFIGEDAYFIDDHWYAVANPGSTPIKTEWGDDFSEGLCTGDRFIAKLGEPDDEEVSITDISENFELYLSGESLIVNSKQNFLLEIYNISGQKILQKEVFPGTEILQFNEPAGIYLAKNKRFVKL